jgi:hypothetical protein
MIITTENHSPDPALRGSVRLVRSYREAGSHLTFCDLEVSSQAGDEVTLRRVDVAKLTSLVSRALRESETITHEEATSRVLLAEEATA